MSDEFKALYEQRITVERCVLNGCERPQGRGTWCRVLGIEPAQPVCEEHWQALRHVRPSGTESTFRASGVSS